MSTQQRSMRFGVVYRMTYQTTYERMGICVSWPGLPKCPHAGLTHASFACCSFLTAKIRCRLLWLVVLENTNNVAGRTSPAQARVLFHTHERHELTSALSMTWDPREIFRICAECMTKCADGHTVKMHAVWSRWTCLARLA